MPSPKSQDFDADVPIPCSPADSTDDLLVELLASGYSHIDAGAEIGRSAKTVQRRLSDPDFAARVEQRRADRLAEATGRLGDALLEAVQALRAELAAERGADRLRAAGMIIDALIKLRTQVGLDVALGQLRAELSELKSQVEEGGA